MSSCPPCLPPKGQLFHFPGTNGPLLLLGEAMPCGPHYVCVPWCCPAPKLPQGTAVFFAPAKVAPPYRPPMPDADPPAVPPTPPVIYGNSPQTCEDICPEGTTGETITVTIPENTYFDEDQAVANAAAMTAACAQVDELRLLSPCVTPEDPATVSIECRSAEGTATLCGCPEFASPSSPPKKYLNLDWTYRVDFDNFPGTLCPSGGKISGWTEHQNANYEYDPETCTVSGAGMEVDESGPVGPLIFTCMPFATHECGIGVLKTPTVMTMFLDDPFCCGAFMGVDNFLFTVANGTATLTNEDTEDDAIARESLTWTAFGPCGEAELSYIEERGGGDYEFAFIAVESRATCELLTIGDTYRVTFTFEKRAFGSSDPFDPMGTTHVIEFVAGATTEVLPDITLPKEHGMEIRITSCVIEDITP